MKKNLHIFLLLFSLLALPGCGGCRKTEISAEDEKKQAEEKLKREKEKQLDPLEARFAAVQPVVGRSGCCKPGHWMSAVLADAQANREDFQGALEMRVVDDDNNQQLAPLYKTPYEMTTARVAVLAKGHPKSLESFFWAPTDMKKNSLVMRLAGSGLEIRPTISLHAMPSYQYFFVVLSRKPARYDFLEKRFDCIRAVRTASETTDDANDKAKRSEAANYRVSLVDPKGHAKLPSQALYWTSIAVLLWDDADPLELDAQQQTAMIDWLHWGGRIIISGPDSLETLRTSFLSPYLPAEATGTRTLKESDLTELKYWSAETGQAPKSLKGWSGVTLNPKPGANSLAHTGNDLVVEKAVGRGRVVVTGFPLSTKELLDWKYCDCFFNACLLGRRPRDLVPRGLVQGEKGDQFLAVEQDTPDARQNTGLRYFSRDEQRSPQEFGPDVAETPRLDVSNAPPGSSVAFDGNTDPGTTEEAGGPGIAAWNDFGPVPTAARSTLVDAAGIRVPDRSFIIKIVAAYLLVLVPLNWLIFRAMGRVEWAWVAAPLIAVGGTVAVVRLAQLNIGFAQAQHEVDIVEMQAGYPRAHVTRYTALYTSLASNYDFTMSDPYAQMMPFPRVGESKDFLNAGWQSRRTLDCRRNETTDLSGFYVASNSIDFLHSETMADLGGSIVYRKAPDGRQFVTNHTKFKLTHGQVMRLEKGSGGRLFNYVALHDLPPEGSTEVNFAAGTSTPLSDGKVISKHFDDSTGRLRVELTAPSQATIEAGGGIAASTGQPSGELKLNKLEAVALNTAGLRLGEMRMIAHADAPLDGFSVNPSLASGDIRRVTLIVVNLDAGKAVAPEPDRKRNSQENDQSAENSPPHSELLPGEYQPLPGDQSLPSNETNPLP